MAESRVAAADWGAWLRREALAWTFVLRTLLAMFLALGVALRLDLATPGSAMVTVAIVALPQTGMVFEKAVYRLLGTSLGAVVTMLLVALLGQHEFVFLGAVALWIGVCTAVSSWFRTFRAYAWLLAGYTTCLIGFPAFREPDHAFDIAVDRVTIVTVGILSAAVVNAVVLPNPTSTALKRQIERAVADCRAFFAAVMAGEAPERVRRRQLRFSVDLGELEQSRLSGVIEDPLVGLRSPRILALTRQLMLALSRLQLLHRLQRTPVPQDRQARLVRDRSHRLLEAEVRASISAVGQAHGRLQSTEPDVGELFISRIGMAADPVQALVAGCRATLVFLLAVLFWIWTDWPDGFLATLFATVLCCLLAAQPDPIAAAWQMCLGVLLSLPASLACFAWVLPAANGLPMLVLGMLPFLVFGAWLMARPGRALMGSGYFMVFLVGLNLGAVMQYDVAMQLNQLAASAVGAMLALVGLAVLSPPDPRWRALRITRRLRGSLRLARQAPLGRLRLRFENEVRELTAQLVAVHPRQDLPARDELLATGVLEVGDAVIRLRQAPPPPAAGHAELAGCLDEVVRVTAQGGAADFAALDSRLVRLQGRLPEAAGEVQAGIELLRVALGGMAEALVAEAHGVAHAA